MDDMNEAESRQHERAATLRALLHGVRDYAIYTVSLDGRISSWHRGAELLKGYSAEEAVGMPFANLFTPEDRERGQPQHELEVAARHGEYKGEGQRVRKDGSRFDVAVVLTALRGPRGELLGFLKLTQDITARRAEERAREEALRASQLAHAEAERASHFKGEFLATLSHELRTPLSAILGWAQVLERGVVEPATLAHGLAAISRNARQQVQLIEDLLDMSRIESGQMRLDLQRVELGAVVAAAIDSALPSATARGLALRTSFEAGPGWVMGDAARLQQVVGNLLDNAIKFTPSGGGIDVSLKREGDLAVVTVADTGQGIAPEFLSRLFDRFQQQDASTTRRHGGLGIGLAIVRQLVLLHGGSVEAHSDGPGQGACFKIKLPAAEAQAQAQAQAIALAPGLAALESGSRLDGLHVLLVDDDADVRDVTTQILHEAGARVTSAASAQEGLELLQQHRPDVLLSDIGMPVRDGYDLIREVRSLPAEAGGRIPAAAFTAYAAREDRERALASGYQLHLAKPVAPQTLVAAAAQLAAAARG